MTALRSREKNTARFEQPSAVKADCPENWNAMKKKPKKYSCSAPIPASSMAASSVKTDSRKCGHCITINQANRVYKMPRSAVKRIP